MGVVRTILLVVFVIICVLLVLLVLVQNEDSNGMGSAFGGGQNVAFGARSASVLTKTTGVLTALFFIVAFSISLLNKAPTKVDLSDAVERVQGASSSDSMEDSGWLKSEIQSKDDTLPELSPATGDVETTKEPTVEESTENFGQVDVLQE